MIDGRAGVVAEHVGTGRWAVKVRVCGEDDVPFACDVVEFLHMLVSRCGDLLSCEAFIQGPIDL